MLACGFVYTGLRLTKPFDRSRVIKILIWVFLSVMLFWILWFPASWILPIDLDQFGLRRMQSWLIFISMGFFMLLGQTLLARDAGLILLWLSKKLGASAAEPERPDRRQALEQILNVGTLFAAATLGAGTFVGARRRAAVREISVPISGLNPGLDGFRIVQISDLHVGYTIGRQYVEAVVDCVNDLNGDIVAITGDLTDGTVEQLRPDVAPLARLQSRYGSFFVTGNHDYYYGHGREWVEEAQRLGLDALVNEFRVIEHQGGRALIAGVPDYKAGDFVEDHASSPADSLADAPETDVRILLAHQPRSAAAGASAGFDLQLSGHTHGGQIFPFQLVARLTQPFIAGLHRVEDMWLYVNRGTGYWGPPFRLLAPSEITVLTLIRDQ